MTEKAEWDISIDNVKERQIQIFKALSDFYHLFTETLKAKRVTVFSQPSKKDGFIICFNIYRMLRIVESEWTVLEGILKII